MEKTKKETLPKFLENLEAVIVKRGGQYLAGDEVSWADLRFVDLVDLISTLKTDFLTPYPNLQSLYEKIIMIPNIANWRNTRPETEF